jgi:hypothetical protein
VPNTPAQRIRHDRLLDEMNAWIEPAMMDDGIAGVPGHEQNFEIGAQPLRRFRQLATIHPGQDNIGQQQIDADAFILETEAFGTE